MYVVYPSIVNRGRGVKGEYLKEALQGIPRGRGWVFRGDLEIYRADDLPNPWFDPIALLKTTTITDTHG